MVDKLLKHGAIVRSSLWAVVQVMAAGAIAVLPWQASLQVRTEGDQSSRCLEGIKLGPGPIQRPLAEVRVCALCASADLNQFLSTADDQLSQVAT